MVSRRQPVIRLLNGASLVIRASLVVVIFNSVWLESVRLLIGGEDSKDTLVVLVQKALGEILHIALGKLVACRLDNEGVSLHRTGYLLGDPVLAIVNFEVCSHIVRKLVEVKLQIFSRAAVNSEADVALLLLDALLDTGPHLAAG